MKHDLYRLAQNFIAECPDDRSPDAVHAFLEREGAPLEYADCILEMIGAEPRPEGLLIAGRPMCPVTVL